jgi:tight adherence protein B
VSLVLPLLAGVLILGAVLTLLLPSRVPVSRHLEPYIVSSRDFDRSRVPAFRRAYALAESAADRLRLRSFLTRALARAGVDIPLGAFVCLSAGIGVLGCLVGTLLLGAGAGIFLGAGAIASCWLVLSVRAKRRERAFERQLPEILDMLAASLRAGHSFDQALQVVAGDIGQPAERELQRVVGEVQLGHAIDDALLDLGDRVRSVDLAFVLAAITVQREVGGSLAPLFELVADTVRAREQFRRKVRALTGMVRTSANVLTALPFVAAVVITAADRSYMRPLWHSSSGHLLVAAAIAMMTVGTTVLRRIGSVRV